VHEHERLYAGNMKWC